MVITLPKKEKNYHLNYLLNSEGILGLVFLYYNNLSEAWDYFHVIIKKVSSNLKMKVELSTLFWDINAKVKILMCSAYQLSNRFGCLEPSCGRIGSFWKLPGTAHSGGKD